MRQRRAEHAGAGVRHAERFQQALQHAVLASALVAVQDVEYAIELLLRQRVDQRRNAVDGDRVDAARLQRFEHVAAGIQRHLALAGLVPPISTATRPKAVGSVTARRREVRTCSFCLAPSKPCVASCCATWPMSPAPISSSRSPSLQHVRQHGREFGSTWLTTTGSLRPRARMARASDLRVGAGDRRFAGGIDLGQHQRIDFGQHRGESHRTGRACGCSDAAGRRPPGACPASRRARRRTPRRVRCGWWP